MQPTTTPYPATLTSSAASLRAVLKDWSTLSEAAQAKVLAGLPTHWLDDFRGEFETFAHDHQRPPRLANSGQDWTTWLVLGGRGAGKTRAGAEWVRRTALADSHARIALVGEGEHETREVMVEGISGLLAVHRQAERPLWIPARRRNGRTVRSRNCSRRKIRKACAGRNFRPRGVTNSPSGAKPKQLLTCCNSGCALASGRGR